MHSVPLLHALVLLIDMILRGKSPQTTYVSYEWLQARHRPLSIEMIVSPRNDGAQHTDRLVFMRILQNVSKCVYQELSVGYHLSVFSVVRATVIDAGVCQVDKLLHSASEAEISLPKWTREPSVWNVISDHPGFASGRSLA